MLRHTRPIERSWPPQNDSCWYAFSTHFASYCEFVSRTPLVPRYESRHVHGCESVRPIYYPVFERTTNQQQKSCRVCSHSSSSYRAHRKVCVYLNQTHSYVHTAGRAHAHDDSSHGPDYSAASDLRLLSRQPHLVQLVVLHIDRRWVADELGVRMVPAHHLCWKQQAKTKKTVTYFSMRSATIMRAACRNQRKMDLPYLRLACFPKKYRTACALS